MDSLHFREVIGLLNHSRSVEIEPQPLRDESGWAVYRGFYRVHLDKQYFHILYIKASATSQDIAAAEHEAFVEGAMYVVYARSLGGRQRLIQTFGARAKRFWTANEYLFSFLEDELTRYRRRLLDERPPSFIPPQFDDGLNNADVDILRSLIAEHDETGADESKITVVLAEPGQGKTYFSRHLGAEIASKATGLVPIIVSSEQWEHFPLHDLRSVSKTITRSLAHFGTPISWIDGHESEFVTTTLRADIVRIVFDGLDEYVLRNAGQLSAAQAVGALQDLAESAGTRIVVTARSSFWSNVVEAELDQQVLAHLRILRMGPFDRSSAAMYFRQRGLAGSTDDALAMFDLLHEANAEYAGRGFVLSLIADLFDRPSARTAVEKVTRNVGRWLLLALCKRETKRAKLPFTADEQLDIFAEFAAEVRTGETPSWDTMAFAIEYVRSDIPVTSRRDPVMLRLREHPLVAYSAADDRWEFKQKQTELLLLAEAITRPRVRLKDLVTRMTLDAATREELAAAVVDTLVFDGLDSAPTRARDLIRALASKATGGMAGATKAEYTRLAGTIALLYVDRVRAGAGRRERAELLAELATDDGISGVTFSGTMARFDLRATVFLNCTFENVSWASCHLSESTVFTRCVFVGGNVTQICDGFGAAIFGDCVLDPNAEAWFDSARLVDGQRAYTLQDLESDIHSVIGKFIHQGGLNTREVKEKYLNKGPIQSSRYQREVIDTLRKYVLQERPGAFQPLLIVREAAREAVRFYATNNELTGPLRQAFDELRVRLKLRAGR